MTHPDPIHQTPSATASSSSSSQTSTLSPPHKPTKIKTKLKIHKLKTKQKQQAQQVQVQPRQQPRHHHHHHAIQAYIPNYLKQFIHPYHGDFCYTKSFHFRLVAQVMAEGFLPIATEGILLPKLHQHRCVVQLPQDLHVSKSVRKKSKKFNFTINQAFDDVVKGCQQQHGMQCWLYDPLVEAFKNIRDAGHVDATLWDEDEDEDDDHGEDEGDKQPPLPQRQRRRRRRVAPVRLYSIEIWNATTGDLAGGELGYTVGSIYTSLTGFSAEDTAGSVQLAALGRLLCQLGFSLWDLGMEMSYKTSLGSHLMPRDDFVTHVHRVREVSLPLQLSGVLPTTSSGTTDTTDENVVNAKTIIDHVNHPVASVLPTTTTTTTTTNETLDNSSVSSPLTPLPDAAAAAAATLLNDDTRKDAPSSPHKHRQTSLPHGGKAFPVEKKQRNVSPDSSQA